jgi:hypothetical protein
MNPEKAYVVSLVHAIMDAYDNNFTMINCFIAKTDTVFYTYIISTIFIYLVLKLNN